MVWALYGVNGEGWGSAGRAKGRVDKDTGGRGRNREDGFAKGGDRVKLGFHEGLSALRFIVVGQLMLWFTEISLLMKTQQATSNCTIEPENHALLYVVAQRIALDWEVADNVENDYSIIDYFEYFWMSGV